MLRTWAERHIWKTGKPQNPDPVHSAFHYLVVGIGGLVGGGFPFTLHKNQGVQIPKALDM